MEPLTILGWPHQPDGSGYYRFWLPFEYLARFSGHRVAIPAPEAYPGFFPADEDLEQCDVIVGQRWMGGGVQVLERWTRSATVVYEVDDDILHPDRSSGLAHLFDDEMQATIRKCLRLAQLVTVSTEPLAEVMREHNENVVVIPNHIHGDVLYIDRPRNDRLTVGWSGGMSHLQDWVQAAGAVGDVLRDRDDVDVHFIGIDYSPMLKIPHSRYTPWTPHVWTFWRQIDFDIGLAPLADTQFNRCKSHIRALEYMALGIPVIASDCPAYREMVVDGVTGYLVRSEDEWRARLSELIEDEAMREEMGKNGRELAARWAVQRGWQHWVAAYEAAAVPLPVCM